MPGNDSLFSLAISSPTNGWKKFSKVYLNCVSQWLGETALASIASAASCAPTWYLKFAMMFLLICLVVLDHARGPNLFVTVLHRAGVPNTLADINVLGDE